MSIRESIARKTLGVKLSPNHPDRLYISDPDLQDSCGTLLSTSRRNKYIPIHQIWRIGDHLLEHDWGEDGIPEWVQDAINESYWAHETSWDHDGGVAWTLQDRMVIQSPFTLTLSDKINNIDTSSTVYSMKLRSWVTFQPSYDDEDLQEIFDEYDITPSPMLTASLEGRERWRKHLDQHVQRAVDAGIELPHIYPTDRTLKPHQEESTLALAGLRFSILADQVGLGKGGSFTSAFLAIVQHDKLIRELPSTSSFPIVVITTKSMKEEIAEEIGKWKQDAKIEVLGGYQYTGISPRTEFIILNIDILSKRLEEIIEADPKGMIIDEAQTVKNADSQRSTAAQELSDHIRSEYGDDSYITLASGTPFLNEPFELWSLLNILGVADQFVDYARSQLSFDKMKIRTRRGWRWVPMSKERVFQARWCGGHTNQYKQWEFGGATNTAELNRMLLEVCMVRRRKSDVMHPLPNLDEQLLTLPMDPNVQEEYDNIDFEFREWMKEKAIEEAEEEGISIQEALQIVYSKLENAEAVMRMTALRQSVARGKIEGLKDWIHQFMSGELEYRPGSGPNQGELIKIGDDPSRQKLIVFAYHRDIQELLIDDPELQQYGLVYIRSGEDPQEAKRLFQKDPRARLMVCYSGAREGHTLTAAKDVLLAEIPFVPSWIVQMAGRCWARLSEDYDPHEATVWYGVSPNTIDALLMHKVRTKKTMFNAVIDGEGQEEMEESDLSDHEQAEILMEMITNGHKAINIAR